MRSPFCSAQSPTRRLASRVPRRARPPLWVCARVLYVIHVSHQYRETEPALRDVISGRETRADNENEKPIIIFMRLRI